jgi:CheY-like chemotaxis protein
MKLSEAAVLVVEDEPMLLEMTSHWFEREGCQVLTAEDGTSALAAIPSTGVDLIVTDVCMPQMDGISMLKNLRDRGLYIPTIVYITSGSDISTRDACDLGVEATFSKPVARLELMAAAERVLTEKGPRWSSPWHGDNGTVLSATFGSLSSAVKMGQVAFGKGGFCVESDCPLQEGPVRLAIEFAADGRKISGYGFVRWSAPRERKVGVEIACLDEISRDCVIHQTARNATLSFIHRTTTAAAKEYGSGFAGDASHEFRNLLAVIIAYSDACHELLKPEDPVRNYVEQIKLCSERAAALVHQTNCLPSAGQYSRPDDSQTRISDPRAR